MCERNGRALDFLNRSLDRRQVLKGLAASGAAATALLVMPMNMAAALTGQTVVKATHGAGLCNLGIFIAKERSLGSQEGVDLEFVVTPTNTDIVTLFGMGAVDVSMIPYSNFLSLYHAGARVKIVAGGGVNGCLIVAAAGINSAEHMRGKTLGTFQADTLEVLPFDWLKRAGMTFKDVDVRYFNTSPEMAQAFLSGAVDAICAVEPYASQCAQSREGAQILSDGTDIYGAYYADCVLAVRNEMLAKERPVVKAVIKSLLVAQGQIETDLQSALTQTVGKYYKTTIEAATLAAKRQPVMVDQRSLSNFILARGQSMHEMGYLKNLPTTDIFDWSPLEEVIRENVDLYQGIKLKTI